jgi:hypothetical protein
MPRLKLTSLAVLLALPGVPMWAQTATQSPGSGLTGTDMVGVPGCHFGE